MKCAVSLFPKKIFLLLAAISVAALIAAGCAPNPGAPEEKVTNSFPYVPLNDVRELIMAPGNEPTTPINRNRTDVRYGPAEGQPGYHVRQVLDLRLPSTGEGPWPLIMYIHGGGFTGGDKGSVDAAFSGHGTRGYALASINYRLASMTTKAFPEAVQDALAAVRHLRVNAVEYRLDPNRFAAAGFSAGGYLTAIVLAISGLDDGDPDLAYFIDPQLGNTHVSSKVQAAASAAALSDFSKLDEQQAANTDVNYMFLHTPRTSPEGQFLGGALNSTDPAVVERLQRSNPLRYLNANTPPIIMKHATNDNLLPWQQSRMMVDAINDIAPGRAVYHQVTTGGHVGWSAAEASTVFNFLNAAMPPGTTTGILQPNREIP
jgi:acetyl esterase/lipase